MREQKTNVKKTIFLTGAAGYVGSLIAEHFACREDVEKVVALDRQPQPPSLGGFSNVRWIQANTADTDEWHEAVKKEQPEVVIHAAWQIRELYGGQDKQRRWNLEGTDAVFDFAFEMDSVARLIHFSTVASYGAFSSNTHEPFCETNRLRESDYAYAEEKRLAEESLEQKYERADSEEVPSVAILRPVAISGPAGRARVRFGLQSALSGELKGRGLLNTVVSTMVAWVPVTAKWVRQYVHEDDVVGIIEHLAFAETSKGYEAYNLAPEGTVDGDAMAKAVGKKRLPVRPWMVRVVFFLAWHLTRGHIPTARGVWKGYSYPIVVDGSKATRVLDYSYQFNAYEAFTTERGAFRQS